MKHVEVGVMSDYVNGLLDGDEAARVSAHLEAGCSRCEVAAAALARVANLAAADARLKLPDGAVRSVKALFAVRQADRLPAGRWLDLRLIEEGSLAPMAVGVRGGGRQQRFTYGGDDLELGILLRETPERKAVELIGELLDRRRGHLTGVPAFVASGETILDRRTTDELGSFCFAVEAERARLSLMLDDDRLIELELRAPAGLEKAWTVQPSRRPS